MNTHYAYTTIKIITIYSKMSTD